ncbi:pyruvate kinase [Lysinibacillus sp. FSL M8-0134]|uniref:pyruvate kinase n=1 Tax=Lysinibacillus sp. FSL M8-0134 TaxID=2921717 RepID=UPI00311A1DD4
MDKITQVLVKLEGNESSELLLNMIKIGVNNFGLRLDDSKTKELVNLEILYELRKNRELLLLIDISSNIKELDYTIEYLKLNKIEPNFIVIPLNYDEESLNSMKEKLKNEWEYAEIIVKICNEYDFNNIDDILLIYDGIFISRDELILNCSPKYLPKIQRNLIKKCHHLNKKTIIDGHFLTNLSKTGIVNRSELSDVALGVRQKANMLTVNWNQDNNNHSEEVISLMRKIIEIENG